MSQNGKSVHSMALQDAACARTIAPRAASGAAMPFVACLGLIARLQLLLQLPHQHAHQVFLDNLYRTRLERGRRHEVGVEARLAELWTKMVKIWHVIEFFFLEW